MIFLLLEAMLVQYMLWLSVCLSHEMAERVELVSGIEASLDLFYTVLQGNLDIPQNKVTSFWNRVPSSGRIQCAATARILTQVLSPWLDPLQIYHPHRPPSFTTERRVGCPRQMSLLL